MKTFACSAFTFTALCTTVNAQPSPPPFTISEGMWSIVAMTQSSAGPTVTKSTWCVQKPIELTRTTAPTLDGGGDGDCAVTEFKQTTHAVHLALSCHNATERHWTIVATLEKNGPHSLLIHEHKQHPSDPPASLGT